MKESTQSKFDAIKRNLTGKKVLVAFSGGVDSTVLASLASDAAAVTSLLTISSPTVPKSELDGAKKIADELGLELMIKEVDWFSDKTLVYNPVDRCFRCKQVLSGIWMETAKELNLDMVLEGTTASETEGYRPGAKALRESGVNSPYLEANVTKEEVREYARSKDLSVAEKPSGACLATRFPYGTEINHELLQMVESVENAVKEIFNVECVRARYHGDLVRIEVGESELHLMFDKSKLKLLETMARAAGFSYVTLDMRGYRTGAMDEGLDL